MPGNNARLRHSPNILLPDAIHKSFVEDLLKVLDETDRSCLHFLNSEVAGFKMDWLRENLLSKFQDLSTTTPEMRKSAAIEKWLRMDDRNSRTNVRLRFMDTSFGDLSSDRVFDTAAGIIQKMIGSKPPANLGGQFTNGASTRVKRSSTAIADKYTGKLHVTHRAWPVFQRELEDCPAWQRLFETGDASPEFVESSVMFTVPKTSQIDRVACKEPEINMYLQRGVGDYIRAKLAENGCNLNDQTRNQRLAREGSREGVAALATLDLSSASDCISTSLVYRLLPLEWVMHLDDIRVHSTLIDGTVHELEMFSSMGNGFTFELESLIFLSLARACTYLTGTRGSVSIYGDDIIVPSGVAGLLKSVLGFCGLTVNPAKSFVRGPFRESCGGHYYGGCDVTPFYVRKTISTLFDLILTLNQLRQWSTDEDVALQYAIPELYNLWKKYSAFVPTYLHGGRELGSDFALITPDLPRKRLKRGDRRRLASQQGALIYWLHRRPEGQTNDPFETSYGTIPVHTGVCRNRTWNTGLPLSQWWWEEVFPPSETR